MDTNHLNIVQYVLRKRLESVRYAALSLPDPISDVFTLQLWLHVVRGEKGWSYKLAL